MYIREERDPDQTPTEERISPLRLSPWAPPIVTMGLYTKLADDIDEVDVIIAGGEILLCSYYRDTNL
jgi:hypothetical protein